MMCLKCEIGYVGDPKTPDPCPYCGEGSLIYPTPEDLLGPDNELGLDHRESQLEMAEEVFFFAQELVFGYKERKTKPVQEQKDHNDLLHHKGALFIEAGTGTGKSLAYLAPLWNMPHVLTIVATSTKALGEQLATKDTKLLADHLGGSIRQVLGRTNYLCALEHDFDAEIDDPSEDEALRVWVESDYGKSWKLDNARDREVLDPVQVCERRTCQHRHTCAYADSRKKVEYPHQVKENAWITNHAWIAHKLVYGGDLIDTDEVPVVVIIDEAHKFADALRSACSEDIPVEFLSNEYGELVDALNLPTKGFHDLSDPKKLEAYFDLRMAIKADLDDWRQENEKAYAELKGVSALSLGNRKTTKKKKQLKKHFNETKKMIRRYERYLRVIPKVSENRKEEYNEDKEVVEVDYWLEGTHMTDDVVWYVQDDTFYRRPLQTNLTKLCSSFLDGSRRPYSFVFCSATLKTLGSFKPVAQDIGIKIYDTMELPAPFNYKKQAFTFLPPTEPDKVKAFIKDYKNPEPWFDTISRGIAGIYKYHPAVIRGMILCASRQDEDELYHRTRRLMGSRAIFLRQEDYRGFGGAGALVEEYKRQVLRNNSVLMFGVASLWEGVSLEGEFLTSVIVPRISFPYSQDLYYQLRCQKIEANGGNSFTALSLPYAIETIRQGSGRLIRTEDDYGFVALLDGRLNTKRWGAQVLRSLDCMARYTRNLDRVAQVVKAWNSD